MASLTYFLAIETFEAYRKTVDGSDTKIDDSDIVSKLLRKWATYVESEGLSTAVLEDILERDRLGVPYQDFLTELQEDITAGKHIMLTVEGDRLIGYSFDLNFEDDVVSESLLTNPDVEPGTEKILRLDGGEITSASSGVSWTITHPDGEATDPSNVVLENKTPFLLFDRDDIA